MARSSKRVPILALVPGRPKEIKRREHQRVRRTERQRLRGAVLGELDAHLTTLVHELRGPRLHPSEVKGWFGGTSDDDLWRALRK